MLRKTLIGIHGPLNGGKDTVANYLMSKVPNFRHYSFAGPLKQACVVMFGFTLEQLEDRTLKEQVDPFWGFTPRRAMQLLGTEFGRNMLRDDVWIKRAEREYFSNRSAELGTIITDVRFENEAAWIRAQSSSLLIYLEVPGLVKDERYNHASEGGIELASSDCIIVNDKKKGLSALYRQLDELIPKIL